MKRSLELMRAERSLQAAAAKYMEALQFNASKKKFKAAIESLYKAARIYSRLAELSDSSG